MPNGAARGIVVATCQVRRQRTAVQWNSNADWLLAGWIDSSSTQTGRRSVRLPIHPIRGRPME
eukprot:351479-Chlamydomonas_euryale.AAC.23